MTIRERIKRAVLEHLFGPPAYENLVPRQPGREPMLLIRYDGPPDEAMHAAVREALAGFGFREDDRAFDFHRGATEIRFGKRELRTILEGGRETVCEHGATEGGR